MFEKCEGIVIRTIDYGETNKIVTIFTREWGKVAAMARGAKKAKQPPFFCYANIYIRRISRSKKSRCRKLTSRGIAFNDAPYTRRHFFNSIRLIRC